MDKIDGIGISKVSTLKSGYDNNCITVTIDDQQYRIDVDDILGVLAEFVYTAEKKRKYTYLKPVLDGMHDSVYLDKDVN